MTADEFNEKYKDYLEEGHYGLDIDNPTVIAMLDKFFTGWIENSIDFKYTQIKLKFGTARAYITGIDQKTIETIERAINILVGKEYEEENI